MISGNFKICHYKQAAAARLREGVKWGLVLGWKSLTAESSGALQGPRMAACGRNRPAGATATVHHGLEPTVHPTKAEGAGLPHTQQAQASVRAIYIPVSHSVRHMLCDRVPEMYMWTVHWNTGLPHTGWWHLP